MKKLKNILLVLLFSTGLFACATTRTCPTYLKNDQPQKENTEMLSVDQMK